MLMLRKKDLAKEFSLVVQQEVVNHNKAILHSNMEMDKLKQEVKSFIAETKNKISHLSHHADDNFSRINDILEKFLTYFDDIFVRFRDIPKAIDKSVCQLKEYQEKKESYYLTIEDFESFVSRVDGWIAAIKQSFDNQKCAIDHKAIELRKEFDEKLEAGLESIFKQMLQSTHDIRDINRHLDRQAVEHSGTKDEIDRLKKSVFLLEKHNEYLMTRLERLTKEKS